MLLQRLPMVSWIEDTLTSDHTILTCCQGFSRDLLGGASGNQQSNAKSKKKRKKKATNPVAGAQGSRYRIAISDFNTLSQFIAEKNVSVPGTFSSTLDRLIKVRSAFGSQLAKHGAALNPIKTEKHNFFLGVLTAVRDVLKHLFAEPGKASVEELSNRFDGLDVYEPTEDAPDVVRPQQVADNVVYEAEPSLSFEDVLCAYTLLVNDLNKIRARIEWIWSNFKAGIFDLPAAALATNTAIDLAHSLIDEVMPLTKAHDGLRQIVTKFYLVQMMMAGHSLESLEANMADNCNFTYETYDRAVGTFLPAYQLVESFAAVLQPDTLPVFKDGIFGFYNPSLDRSSKTGKQKFRDDKALIMPFFAELAAVVMRVDGYPVQDELLRGIHELHSTRKIPFYLIFSAQVFLDITYILQGDTSRGFKVFEARADGILQDIKAHQAFHKKLKCETWPRENDEVSTLR